MSSSFPQPGSIFSGYIVRALHPLPELNATLIELRHQVTGARHVHIQNQDRNNLFFRIDQEVRDEGAEPAEAAVGQARVAGHMIFHHSNAEPERFTERPARQRIGCVRRGH